MPRTTIESEELALQSPGLDLDAVQAMGDQRVVLVVEDDIDTLNLLKLTLRRAGPKTRISKIAFPENGLSMDLETHQASYRGNTIDLTPREFSVLEILAKHHPKPVAYEPLAPEVWGQDNEKIRERIKWIVYLLRQKIEKDPSNPKLILNKTRYGYHLAV